MGEETEPKDLVRIADELRCLTLQMIHNAGSGHPGGSLSAADLIAALYFREMRIDPTQPRWCMRDRFVLSKGHAAPVLYAALARRGYFPIQELDTLRRLGSRLQGHPDMAKTPGVDATTGSLGLGLSIAGGMALGAKIRAHKFRVFVMLGCGEQQEGQVWEAAMAAAHYALGNLTAVIDYNGLQIDGRNADVMECSPLADKWAAFGWDVREIDGHNMEEICEVLAETRKTSPVPRVYIAHTVKGKGVSFMENRVEWHAGSPDEGQLATAMNELGHRGGR